MSLWDISASLYKYFRNHFVFKLILKRENQNLRRLLEQVPAGRLKVLDIGTGMGNALSLMADTNLLIGLDRSFAMLRFARSQSGAQFLHADANHLPFRANTFDLILSIGLFEYLPTSANIFNEICRIIKRRGFLIVTISPPNILNYLRLLLGHKIYPMKSEQFKHKIESHYFTIINKTKTLMQEQYLLKFYECLFLKQLS